VSGATAESSPPEPLPRGRARAPGFGPNLARRVTTALVALPALSVALLVGPPWLAVALVAAALAAGLFEYFALMRARAVRPMRTVGVLVAGALFLDVVTPGWLGVPFLPLGALLLLTFTLSRGAELESVGAAATTLLGAVYLGALGGTIAGLRLIEPLAQGGLRLVLLLGILVAADSVAFFVGNAFGRRRLLPGVSPGKSVEGALCGLAGGVAGAFAVRALGLPELPAWHTAGLGLAVAAMGIVGDLDESLLKRWAGVKDSGTLFPGHGGMLDRLDSLLFGAPVLYYYFEFVR
jgi:phosphatidate cytidylyltransferase